MRQSHRSSSHLRDGLAFAECTTMLYDMGYLKELVCFRATCCTKDMKISQ